MKQSAGLVVFRLAGDQLEVLLVHPSGNYNRHKPWSIPKGLPDEGETLETAAIRETLEEAGVSVAGPSSEMAASLRPLGYIDYSKSGKRIHAFAVPAPADASPHPASWEVDRAEFLPLAEARRLIHREQLPFLDRLDAMLANDAAPSN